MKLLHFSILLLFAIPAVIAQEAKESPTHKWEIGIRANQVVFNHRAVFYRENYAGRFVFDGEVYGEYKSPVRNFKFNKGSHYYFGITAARLKGKWFYRVRLDYLYHIHKVDFVHYHEQSNRVQEIGKRFKDTGLQLAPGAGRIFDWKFLTFKVGIEIPVYYDWITRERSYYKYYEPDNPESWTAWERTYPSGGFVKLAAITGVDVRFYKRFSAGIELSNGILFYKIKGGAVYTTEYYSASGTLYKTTSMNLEYPVKGNFNYDLLVPSFNLSYRL